MYESGSDREEVRNTMIVNTKVLETWLDENELELNTKKTRVMYLGSSASKCSDNESGVQFHGTPLAMCQQFKYLEVMVNNALNWNDHIGMIQQASYRKLSILRMGRRFASKIVCTVHMLGNHSCCRLYTIHQLEIN